MAYIPPHLRGVDLTKLPPPPPERVPVSPAVEHSLPNSRPASEAESLGRKTPNDSDDLLNFDVEPKVICNKRKHAWQRKLCMIKRSPIQSFTRDDEKDLMTFHSEPTVWRELPRLSHMEAPPGGQYEQGQLTGAAATLAELNNHIHSNIETSTFNVESLQLHAPESTDASTSGLDSVAYSPGLVIGSEALSTMELNAQAPSASHMSHNTTHNIKRQSGSDKATLSEQEGERTQSEPNIPASDMDVASAQQTTGQFPDTALKHSHELEKYLTAPDWKGEPFAPQKTTIELDWKSLASKQDGASFIGEDLLDFADEVITTTPLSARGDAARVSVARPRDGLNSSSQARSSLDPRASSFLPGSDPLLAHKLAPSEKHTAQPEAFQGLENTKLTSENTRPVNVVTAKEPQTTLSTIDTNIPTPAPQKDERRLSEKLLDDPVAKKNLSWRIQKSSTLRKVFPGED